MAHPESSIAGHRGRRDVERNHEAIVTGAIEVLADAPEATMSTIATASGIGRSTLYRHFPDRAALVAAISVRVRTEAEELVVARLREATVPDAVEVLVTLADALVGLGVRYRFLLQQEERRLTKTGGRVAPDDDRERVLFDFIVQAQQAGSLRTDLDSEWLVLVFIQTLMAAIKAEFLDPATQRASLRATVRSLVSPP